MPLEPVCAYSDVHFAQPCRDVKCFDCKWQHRIMTETKPSNPKDAVGIKKFAVSTVSAPFIAAVSIAMLEGALKYGRHNYRTIGVRSSVYYDALMRHMFAWWEGQDIDPESGESHIVKAGACLAVLFDSMYRGNLTDDRPPRVKDGWVDEFNQKAKALVEKYPEPKPAHTQWMGDTDPLGGRVTA